jgi:hypothetical protein
MSEHPEETVEATGKEVEVLAWLRQTKKPGEDPVFVATIGKEFFDEDIPQATICTEALLARGYLEGKGGVIYLVPESAPVEDVPPEAEPLVAPASSKTTLRDLFHAAAEKHWEELKKNDPVDVLSREQRIQYWIGLLVCIRQNFKDELKAALSSFKLEGTQLGDAITFAYPFLKMYDQALHNAGAHTLVEAREAWRKIVHSCPVVEWGVENPSDLVGLVELRITERKGDVDEGLSRLTKDTGLCELIAMNVLAFQRLASQMMTEQDSIWTILKKPRPPKEERPAKPWRASPETKGGTEMEGTPLEDARVMWSTWQKAFSRKQRGAKRSIARRLFDAGIKTAAQLVEAYDEAGGTAGALFKKHEIRAPRAITQVENMIPVIRAHVDKLPPVDEEPAPEPAPSLKIEYEGVPGPSPEPPSLPSEPATAKLRKVSKPAQLAYARLTDGSVWPKIQKAGVSGVADFTTQVKEAGGIRPLCTKLNLGSVGRFPDIIEPLLPVLRRNAERLDKLTDEEIAQAHAAFKKEKADVLKAKRDAKAQKKKDRASDTVEQDAQADVAEEIKEPAQTDAVPVDEEKPVEATGERDTSAAGSALVPTDRTGHTRALLEASAEAFRRVDLSSIEESIRTRLEAGHLKGPIVTLVLEFWTQLMHHVEVAQLAQKQAIEFGLFDTLKADAETDDVLDIGLILIVLGYRMQGYTREEARAILE